MRIVTQAIRVIDYENNKISARNIMPKFGEYIEQLISYINGNVSVREYKTQSTGTEVISSILEIIKHQAEAEIVLQRIDIWKTCLFEIDDLNSVKFLARIYSNTVAKYWWHDFLELNELQSDELNTKRAFKAVESTLSRNLKKDAPYDHMVIRNAMYLYFSSVEQFDFSEMLDKTIKNYSPNDMKAEKKEELIQKLCDLPEKQHFDHQFKPVLSMIKPKMKKTYDVYSGIQIKVSSAVEDLEDIIEAYEDGDGKRYLKIRMDNDITFRTFERREGR